MGGVQTWGGWGRGVATTWRLRENQWGREVELHGGGRGGRWGNRSDRSLKSHPAVGSGPAEGTRMHGKV